MPNINYKTIDDYIAVQDKNRQEVLQKAREAIKKAAPKAVEKIAWGMPTFWQGGNLIHFAVFKNHFSIFPGEKAAEVFAGRLSAAGADFDKGTIRFAYGKIDYDLIADIVKMRVSESAK